MQLRQNQPVHPAQKEKKEKKQGGLAFFLSILFHASILLLVGGVVLIPAVVQKSAFVSDPGMGGTSEATMEIPPDTSNLQNELPDSQSPQETMQIPDQPTTVTPTDIVVARQDTSMASSTWARSVTSTHSVEAKMPVFKQDDTQNEKKAGEDTPEKKVSVGSRITLFGSTEVPNGGGLAGIFYDLKRSPNGLGSSIRGNTPEGWSRILLKFTGSGWDEDYLKRYYWKSKDVLYAKQIYIPDMDSDEAPKAFNVKAEASGWIIVYKGYVTPPRAGEYRFIGTADSLLIVRFNKEVVVDSTHNAGSLEKGLLRSNSNWPADPKATPQYNNFGMIGDWIRMEKGKAYPIEILIGDRLGGRCFSRLFVESKGSGEVLVFSTEPELPKEIITSKWFTPPSSKPAYFKIVNAPPAAPSQPGAPESSN